jgi:hypothetical protein
VRTYRGVVVVTHQGDVPKDELIQHLAERTLLDVHESEIDGLQVVILWRSLIDMEGDE